MAKTSRAKARSGKAGTGTSKAKKKPSWLRRFLNWVAYWGARVSLGALALAVFLVALWGVFNPPVTLTMLSEKWRLGEIDRSWVPIEEIAPVMVRSVVAAEDANFCLHWGFDVAAIKDAIEDGGTRGASTITQQVVKNVFLWQGRSWVRKMIETAMTPLVEALWTKRRVLEVYLNVAEFGEGVFGVEAAARREFGVGPDKLSAAQAARLAAVLPSPKKRSAGTPSDFVRKRAAQIADGAETIRADGRATCFED